MPIACWLFWNIPEPLGLAFRSQDFPEVPGSFAQGTLPLLLLLAVAPHPPSSLISFFLSLHNYICSRRLPLLVPLLLIPSVC